MSLSFLKETLLPVPYAKDLGVIFDRYLTFDNHVGDVVSSCMAKLCQINKVKHCFDCDTLIKIITTLVLSKLYYCSSIWSNTSIGNIKKLQAVPQPAKRRRNNVRACRRFDAEKWLKTQMESTLRYRRCFDVVSTYSNRRCFDVEISTSFPRYVFDVVSTSHNS